MTIRKTFLLISFMIALTALAPASKAQCVYDGITAGTGDSWTVVYPPSSPTVGTTALIMVHNPIANPVPIMLTTAYSVGTAKFNPCLGNCSPQFNHDYQVCSEACALAPGETEWFFVPIGAAGPTMETIFYTVPGAVPLVIPPFAEESLLDGAATPVQISHIQLRRDSCR